MWKSQSTQQGTKEYDYFTLSKEGQDPTLCYNQPYLSPVRMDILKNNKHQKITDMILIQTSKEILLN